MVCRHQVFWVQVGRWDVDFMLVGGMLTFADLPRLRLSAHVVSDLPQPNQIATAVVRLTRGATRVVGMMLSESGCFFFFFFFESVVWGGRMGGWGLSVFIAWRRTCLVWSRRDGCRMQ